MSTHSPNRIQEEWPKLFRVKGQVYDPVQACLFVNELLEVSGCGLLQSGKGQRAALAP